MKIRRIAPFNSFVCSSNYVSDAIPPFLATIWTSVWATR